MALKPFSRYISPLWGGLLLLLVSVLYLTPSLGWRVDDVQMVLFPFVLLAFWRLPRSTRFRLPVPLVVLAVALWLTSAAYVEGIFAGSLPETGAYVARFEKDPRGMAGRDLLRRYNQIARTYELPRAMQLEHVVSAADIQTFLDEHRLTPFVIFGRADWFDMEFSGNIARYLGPLLPAIGEPAAEAALREARQMGLFHGENVILIQPSGFAWPLAVTYQPEKMVVPGEPAELTRHWAAWLGQGLVGQPKLVEHLGITEARAAFIATRNDGFAEAAQIAGAWKTNSPLGLAEYFVGTLELLDAATSDHFSDTLRNSVLARYRTAAGYVEQESSPETYAAIFNNAAVALLFTADETKDLEQVRRWLDTALDTKVRGDIPLGVKAALFNMDSLARNGLLPSR
ncbi:MAG: hypothetical protein KDD69_07390 [Bdellovibrionales bacterium]|nr:hypothetical protein [Bdellovibrionales bacterium]